MPLYGKDDSVANQTKVALVRGNGSGSVGETIVFVDETEASLDENKSRGITGPGWWAYRTYTDTSGKTRHKANHLMVLADAEANSGETLSDDTIAADVSVVIAIQTQPADTAVAVGAALQLVLAATATPPGDASVLTFQWQKKSGKKWANVSGATATTFDVATYAATDAGSYRVKINSTNGATEKISAVAVVTTA